MILNNVWSCRVVWMIGDKTWEQRRRFLSDSDPLGAAAPNTVWQG